MFFIFNIRIINLVTISFWVTGEVWNFSLVRNTRTEDLILFGITYEESLLWDLRISLWVGLPVLQLHLILPRRLYVKLARFNYDVRFSMIVYSVFKPFILSMCVTNSYTIGSPSTDSSIELVFAPRNEALNVNQQI